MKRWTIYLALAFALGATGRNGAGAAPVLSSVVPAISNGLQLTAQQQCYPVTACLAPGCVPLPTSLVPVNTRTPIPNNGYQIGWMPTYCGTKRCLVIFRRVCGPPLGIAEC